VKSTSAPAIALLLAGGMFLLPFLVPYHQQPVLSFFPEWLAAALGCAAALVVLARRDLRADAALPAPALWLGAFALFVALRAASGDQAYPQVSLLAALYVLYAVLMIQLGAQLAAAHGVERVAAVLAAFLLAGALVNAGAGAIQFYGRPGLYEDLIAELRGSRAYGNIAQANLYANYLALGAASLIYLWLRGRLRSAAAIAALGLIALGSALSGSRSALLYAVWFAALAPLAARVPDRADARRLKFGAYCVACAMVLAHFAVPWANSAFHLGPAAGGALDRLAPSSQEQGEPRLAIYAAALRVFASAPLAGAGMGEFAGAAFAQGLDASLTSIAEVWTSPHNLVLQLLAETGVIGAILVLGALGTWGLQFVRRCRADANPALWWFAAAAGVGLLHSVIEFPLWSAHFLGVTALLLGASAGGVSRAPAVARSARFAGIAAVTAISLTLAILLQDYVRLDIARVTGTAMTLAPPAQTQRDAATMRALAHGLLAPVAELWIVTGTPLDRGDLAGKLAMSERAARHWPANGVLVRRAVFLAMAGRPEEARRLLGQALRTFPQGRGMAISILEQALAGDPAAVGPLLDLAQGKPAARRRLDLAQR
jgi:O-antigen ligase